MSEGEKVFKMWNAFHAGVFILNVITILVTFLNYEVTFDVKSISKYISNVHAASLLSYLVSIYFW